MPDFRCAAVVLAAGASTRLGRPKQLIVIEGETLLRRAARLAVEAGFSPVCVVLGFEAEPMQAALAGLAVEVVLNRDWQEGMGSSLRYGMEAITKQERQPAAVLVMVCDQPRLSADHLRELAARHQAAQTVGDVAITASAYARRAGVPAIFSLRIFPELLASSGDRGARDVIRAHAGAVQTIPWPAGDLDLDRPEDLTTIEPQF
jgi:molybdenum cofactor cytidylyltransferase